MNQALYAHMNNKRKMKKKIKKNKKKKRNSLFWLMFTEVSIHVTCHHCFGPVLP
jgi:hypothetical protein